MAAPPKPVTPQNLEASALAYLARFASSSANLSRLLQHRVRRSAAAHGTDPAEADAWIDALIVKLQRAGLLNDTLYAEAKAASLHRRGVAGRVIAATLAAKGIPAPLIKGALSEEDDETGLARRPGGDRAAAIAFARRRRLGPFRPPETRTAHTQKDLARMARAGFDQATAMSVILASDEGEWGTNS